MNKECAIFRLKNVKSDVRERVGERLVYISIEENTSGRAGRGPGGWIGLKETFHYILSCLLNLEPIKIF